MGQIKELNLFFGILLSGYFVIKAPKNRLILCLTVLFSINFNEEIFSDQRRHPRRMAALLRGRDFYTNIFAERRCLFCLLIDENLTNNRRNIQKTEKIIWTQM